MLIQQLQYEAKADRKGLHAKIFVLLRTTMDDYIKISHKHPRASVCANKRNVWWVDVT